MRDALHPSSFILFGTIMANYAAITGWGMAIPERVLTNADLARMIDTSDEWITTRTGIRERRVVSPGESTSTLATEAGRRALAQAGLADRKSIRLNSSHITIS